MPSVVLIFLVCTSFELACGMDTPNLGLRKQGGFPNPSPISTPQSFLPEECIQEVNLQRIKPRSEEAFLGPHCSSLLPQVKSARFPLSEPQFAHLRNGHGGRRHPRNLECGWPQRWLAARGAGRPEAGGAGGGLVAARPGGGDGGGSSGGGASRVTAPGGGEMRLLALAAVLLARAPAPGKRGGAGRTGGTYVW